MLRDCGTPVGWDILPLSQGEAGCRGVPRGHVHAGRGRAAVFSGSDGTFRPAMKGEPGVAGVHFRMGTGVHSGIALSTAAYSVLSRR